MDTNPMFADDAQKTSVDASQVSKIKKPFKPNKWYWYIVTICFFLNVFFGIFALIYVSGSSGFYTESYGYWLNIIGVVSLIATGVILSFCLYLRLQAKQLVIAVDHDAKAIIYSENRSIYTKKSAKLGQNLGQPGQSDIGSSDFGSTGPGMNDFGSVPWGS
jgi:cytochrome c biogenesis protein CcdA